MDIRWVRWLVSPLVVVGAIALALILFTASVSILWVTRPKTAAPVPVTAVLKVVVAPSPTLVTGASTISVQVTATAPIPPSPPPGVITINAFVQISGTGGDGLRLRIDPGLDSQVRFLALEAEVFQVRDGPREESGYTWWYLVAPFDETRRGWAVSNYLIVVQNP